MRNELRDAAPIWLKFLPAWLEIFVLLGVLPSNTVLHRVIESWFHFPPHLSSATTLPWEITEHKKRPISP